jgi:RNA polymerase sigma factor (sigma-70 family)
MLGAVCDRKVAHAIAQAQRHRLHEVPLPNDQDQETEEVEAHKELADPCPASDPAAAEEWRETVDELQGALHTLSEEQQVVLTGRFLAGQSVEDLAQALHKRPGAVRALQFRALGKLAERLGLTARRPQEARGGKHAT